MSSLPGCVAALDGLRWRSMQLEETGTKIDGLKVRHVHEAIDSRGPLWEMYRESGSEGVPVQVNVMSADRGVVRGLHGEAETSKLFGVIAGEALGVFVDTRRGSPTFGAVETVKLVPGMQVTVPSGVCNGFQALLDRTCCMCALSREWRPDMPGVYVNPFDPALGIEWPVAVDHNDRAYVSERDANAPFLRSVIP